MRGSPLLPVVLAALALAGCTAPPQPQPATQPEPTADAGADAGNSTTLVVPVEAESPAPTHQVFPFAGKITLGAGAQGVGYVSPTGSMDAHYFTFHVNPGAVAIVAELKWDDPSMSLVLEVGSPDCDATAGTGYCAYSGDQTGQGASPIRGEITNPKALNATGEWKLWIWGKQAVDTQFQSVVSVFYGAPPDANYTAFNQTQPA